MLENIKEKVNNFYIISTCIFVVVMLFFAETDLFLHSKLIKEKNALTTQKEYLEDKIVEIKEERKTLIENNFKIEKYAREVYLMKKPSEDLFIVTEE